MSQPLVINTHLQCLTSLTHLGSLQNLLYLFPSMSILKPQIDQTLSLTSSRTMVSPNPKYPYSLEETHTFSLILTQKRFFRPKREFFYSKGISSIDLAKSLTAKPTVLHCSLKNQIIPCFDYLKGLLRSDDKLITAIKRFPDILTQDPLSYIEPNIATLQQYGVPESIIMFLLYRQPRTLITKPDEFKEVVEEVKKMGINPSRAIFVLAIYAKRGSSKSTWEKKWNVYRTWGSSEEEISLAFTKYPWCMLFSEDKIMAAMDIFVNKLGWESSLIARCPTIIAFSSTKRIAPRCSVLQVLLSEGLIDRCMAISTVFMCPDKLFLRRCVARCEEKVPHLLKLYQEQMDLSN